MPTRDKHYRCYCTGCCEVDQTGMAKNPPGKLQLERHKAIHLRDTSSLDPATPDACRAAVANLALGIISQQGGTELNIDSLSAALFAASLCDNGPDLDSQPSKLWASREEFQKDATNTNVGVLDITDVIGAVGQISSENMSDASQVPSIPSITPSLQPRVDDPTLPRQERSRRTVKAHQVLDSIAARIQAIEQRTLKSESMEMHAALWAQLGGIRKALAAVNRRAPSLVSQKDQLFLSLSKLEKQIDEHAKNIDATSKAVKYNSSHHFNYPINRCDEVAQVSVFIGVVSVILFGLSRRTGEFILGVMSIILTLTFKLLGKSIETLHNHILAQIPTNMNTTLQRFNLVTHTTTYAV
ncbi:hypothetical protein SCLCIDRAFT_98339, partial [Scleroderma citrinum Foug A]